MYQPLIKFHPHPAIFTQVLCIFVNMTNRCSTYSLPEGFTTSINAVEKVLCISVSVIINELRKNNYLVDDDSSNCIDVKMLERFAELYKKRLKRYFTSCVDNISNLTHEEYSDFVDFCKTFSKNATTTFNWRHIDKDAIKDTFFQEIKKATTSSLKLKIEVSSEMLDAYLKVLVSRRNDSLPVLDVKTLISELIGRRAIKQIPEQYVESIIINENPQDKRISVLNRVKHSIYYHCKLKKQKPTNQGTIKQRHKLFICLRLHIVPDDGNAEGELYKIA